MQMYFTHNYTPVLWYQHLKWRTKIAKGPISVTQLVPRGTNLVAVLLPWGRGGGGVKFGICQACNPIDNRYVLGKLHVVIDLMLYAEYLLSVL